MVKKARKRLSYSSVKASGGKGKKKEEKLDLFGDDDLEELEDKQKISNAFARAIKKEVHKYQPKEGDSLWEKVTKTYLRVGVFRLFGIDEKKKMDANKLPSLKTKYLKKEKDNAPPL